MLARTTSGRLIDQAQQLIAVSQHEMTAYFESQAEAEAEAEELARQEAEGPSLSALEAALGGGAGGTQYSVVKTVAVRDGPTGSTQQFKVGELQVRTHTPAACLHSCAGSWVVSQLVSH